MLRQYGQTDILLLHYSIAPQIFAIPSSTLRYASHMGFVVKSTILWKSIPYAYFPKGKRHRFTFARLLLMIMHGERVTMFYVSKVSNANPNRIDHLSPFVLDRAHEAYALFKSKTPKELANEGLNIGPIIGKPELWAHLPDRLRRNRVTGLLPDALQEYYGEDIGKVLFDGINHKKPKFLRKKSKNGRHEESFDMLVLDHYDFGSRYKNVDIFAENERPGGW